MPAFTNLQATNGQKQTLPTVGEIHPLAKSAVEIYPVFGRFHAARRQGALVFAAVNSPVNQARSFQGLHVLGDRGITDLEGSSQLTNCGASLREAGENPTPCAVGKGEKDLIELWIWLQYRDQ